MNYWMGIDGGGSHLRVAITDDDLNIIAQVESETANPSIIGHEAAALRIETTVDEALRQAGLTVALLSGVGVGIAGASVSHSERWLREVMAEVLPGVPPALSSDIEIALVGAHGKREGVLVLAGTGSIAYGIDGAGKACQVGGWGYLVGDEGSGYWIGAKAIQVMTQMADCRVPRSQQFVSAILTALQLTTEKEVVRWLYHSGLSRNREIAGLASVILSLANEGVAEAAQIVEQAAESLTTLGLTVVKTLAMDNPAIAFAGGLLQTENPLSRRLCDLLGLAQFPESVYSPVVGAALLSQLTIRNQ